MKQLDLEALLGYINPSTLSYQEWLNVGMALKEEGYTASVWDQWSRQDSRYRDGEPYRKWDTFQDSGITGATITQMAKENGWQSKRSEHSGALDWNSSISNELQVVDSAWVEDKEVYEPSNWQPHEQIIRYLNTLFDSNDYIGYVTETWSTEDGKLLPKKGVYTKTAGELVQELTKYKDDIGFVIGDYNEQAGAWIRFNPLDGHGVKNDNVTDFRYALVESDETEIARQNALLRELELPIVMLVHSGGKSLHAIVRVDANSLPQYKERVNHIYDVCLKNGLEVDRQNKNPSRLSRLPGIMRQGNKQFIVDENIGKATYEEWEEWIEAVNDDLPDPENLSEVWENMPEKNPELIHGVLRQGHKMLLAGASKAGKSFALIELSIALAEGREWLGWSCEQGKVLYVNMELDPASAFHRFKDVYDGLGYSPNHVNNIDIWNLRGNTVPMDKLAPKLIRRAEKQDYIAVIIDPIYKVLTGDENSAEDMAHFTNQFDKIASQLKSAVIYCHHHSKGAQGGKKSMDRASGSGVFARDPDAILDLVQLEISEGLLNQQKDEQVCEVYKRYLFQYAEDYVKEHVGRDDQFSVQLMTEHINAALGSPQKDQAHAEALQASEQVKQWTAWRIDGTLREFQKFDPRNLWFRFPVHQLDETELLQKASPESDSPPWQKGADSNKDNKKTRKQERMEALEEAFDSIAKDGQADIEELAEMIGKSERTIMRHIKEHKNYEISDGFAVEK